MGVGGDARIGASVTVADIAIPIRRWAAGVTLRRIAARTDPPPVLARDRPTGVVGAPEATSSGHGGGGGEQETDDEAAHGD
jgi:hypothetical protein